VKITDNKNKFTLTKLAQLIALSGLALNMAGCGLDEASDANSNNGETVYDFAPPEPKAGDEQYSMLKQDRERWMNEQGEIVSLRGVNLGNWLMLEMWMLNNGDNPVGEGIVDQCTFEGTLEERFGADERARLMDVYRDNFITERDWDILQDAGFNLIRLPFPYQLIEDDANPMTLRDDAWQYLDYAIEEAKARNMWVVLDLHGAAGAQGWEHHSGCEGKNEYWEGDNVAENQERTRWLWQQIAGRYKDEPAVAGYGVLNEPWGTDAETLAENVTGLYHAIREVDQEHIVILPGHNSGIDAYGDPDEAGMTNVAFEMHFYPGIFGWGEIGYDVHREWLTCGQNGTTGVCEWDERIRELDTPFLIGEMQPWTGLGEQGGPITRATFDRYNELSWAATAWSYKVLTINGGQGNGTWGYVTNKGERLLAKASTWNCAGWDSPLAEACENPTKVVTPTEDDQTFYLIVKSGSLGGVQDIRIDDLQFTAQSSGENILQNSTFDTASNWIEWSATNSSAADDNLIADVGYADGDENILRISAQNGFANGGVYQEVQLTGGESYLLSGTFRDAGSADTWAEFYLLPASPQNGQDVSGAAMAGIDLNNASIEEIEAYFANMSAIEYEVNESVYEALSADQPADIFNFPDAPQNLTLENTAEGMSLVWMGVANATYNVYRTTSSGSNYQLLAAEVDSEMYLDTTTAEGVTYFYIVTANNGEESYASNEVATEIFYATIPGRIEAEHFSGQSGFQVEDTQDEGGGQNLGYTDPGDTLTYNVEVAEAGDYTLTLRIASSGGSEGISFAMNGASVGSIAVPDTGDWQNWQTISTTVTLQAGEQELLLTALGGAWNLNWMEFTKN
jgi:endoglucanase